MNKDKLLRVLDYVRSNYETLKQNKLLVNRFIDNIEYIREDIEDEIERLKEIGKQEGLTDSEEMRVKSLEDYMESLSTFYVYVKELEDIINEFPITMILNDGERLVNENV